MEVALLSVGAAVGGVDEAATLAVVDDVAAGAVTATVVDDVIKSLDVLATCARTGLTIANPIASATMSAMAPTNAMTLAFILIS